MNWIESLYQTYENNIRHLGYSGKKGSRPLLPPCHTTQQANVEVVIDGNGKFRRANLIQSKKDAITIIPCTEDSAGRTRAIVSHPLSDKLRYLAGDFSNYGGIITAKSKQDPGEPYRLYLELLTKWCNSAYSHPAILAVHQYVEEKCLIKDLVSQKILLAGPTQKLLTKKETVRNKNSIDIFSSGLTSQYDAVIRWIVETPEVMESRTWMDQTLWKSWSDYCISLPQKTAVCLVTGTTSAYIRNYPRYIRSTSDGAKIISANDTDGFTYRGRFLDSTEACTVSTVVAQKAHNTLAWLIDKQGYLQNDLAIVAWSTGEEVRLPQPMTDPIDAFSLYQDAAPEEPDIPDTAQEVAVQFKKQLQGYGSQLKHTERVCVIALESASKGRMAIIYFRELSGSEYLRRIDDWHESCAWLHRYRKIPDPNDPKKKIRKEFIGAPAPADIAKAAYGEKADEKLLSVTVQRILPCIIDGLPFPRDLMELTVRNASNRVSKKNGQWEKILSIACSVYKKHKTGKEIYSMYLDETRKTRDYLYGRLLAVADHMEERTLYLSDQSRATNAARYMQQFSQKPCRTWRQLHDSLTPCFLRLKGAYFYKNLIAEITCSFLPEDYLSDKPLSGEYLLGYYSQRKKLYEKKQNNNESENISNTSAE